MAIKKKSRSKRDQQLRHNRGLKQHSLHRARRTKRTRRRKRRRLPKRRKTMRTTWPSSTKSYRIIAHAELRAAQLRSSVPTTASAGSVARLFAHRMCSLVVITVRWLMQLCQLRVITRTLWRKEQVQHQPPQKPKWSKHLPRNSLKEQRSLQKQCKPRSKVPLDIALAEVKETRRKRRNDSLFEILALLFSNSKFILPI